jgi:co-chaperonin GroES (HSP10)
MTNKQFAQFENTYIDEDTTLIMPETKTYMATLTTKNRLIVEKIVSEKKTKYGIHLPETAKEELFIPAIVLAVGPEVKQVQVDDVVYFPRSQVDNIPVRINHYVSPELNDTQTIQVISEDDVMLIQREKQHTTLHKVSDTELY